MRASLEERHYDHASTQQFWRRRVGDRYGPLSNLLPFEISLKSTSKTTTRRTIFVAVLGHAQRCGGRRAVAEHKLISSPGICTSNFDVACVTRSNFEPGIDVNGSFAIMNHITTIKVMSVRNSINISVEALRVVRG
jgi:hypothetical protein